MRHRYAMLESIWLGAHSLRRVEGASLRLAGALRRAEAAHGEHEKRSGQHDADWPDWYAEYIVREQAGEPPPP